MVGPTGYRGLLLPQVKFTQELRSMYFTVRSQVMMLLHTLLRKHYCVKAIPRIELYVEFWLEVLISTLIF